jgi:MYXO-CTERM domain-containing protein
MLNKHVLSVAVGVALTALAAKGRATTYQLGPTRTYKTFAALPTLRPGDVVEVDGGATYASVVFDAPGTAAQKITVRGIPVGGQRPIISGGTNTVEVQGDHFVLDGFDLTGGSSRCFYHHADDVTLRNSVIHDCPSMGVLGADTDSGSLLMEYDEVHHCAPPASSSQHQIYMATDEGTHPGSVFRMQFCYVHDGLGGNNIKSRAERNEIYYNWIEGAYYHELEMIGPDLAGGTTANEGTAREDSDVVGNVFRKTGSNPAFFVTRVGGDGNAQTNGRYRFVNNTIIVASTSAVFRLFDGLESIEMHNNVIYRAGGGPVNLTDTSSVVWATGSAVIAGLNNWIGTGSTNVPSQWTGTLTGTDPGLIAQVTDLRPAATSPLVNAGMNTPATIAGHPFPSPLATPAFVPSPALLAVGAAVARPTNGTIDIGAYEFGTSSGGGATGGAAGTSGGIGGASGGGLGGSSGSAGATGTAGRSGTGGTSGGAGAGGQDPNGPATGGCSCATTAQGRRLSNVGLFGGFGVVVAFRRRRARDRKADR